jgi:hypothetical protein
MRGAIVLNRWDVKLAGLSTACGAIDVFTIGLAAGATRLVTTRGEAVCAVALITCPPTVWMLTESAAINQKAEILKCFIKCSAH